jgi:hypothetical protein
MAYKKWFESSPIREVRLRVSDELGAKFPKPLKPRDEESPGTFWKRVEAAGLLPQALELYDRRAAEWEAARQVRRETKVEFQRRIEREGRTAEAERRQAELRKSGLTEREVQEQLVVQMQPLDGETTRAWRTPDPWVAGRLFRKKADHDRLAEEAREYDDEDEDSEAAEARWRIECAESRRDERQALAAARQRLRALSTTEATSRSA